MIAKDALEGTSRSGQYSTNAAKLTVTSFLGGFVWMLRLFCNHVFVHARVTLQPIIELSHVVKAHNFTYFGE